MEPRAALIVAHPGHELLVHHWLELAHPIVCALTDGSGSRAHDRSARSKAIIRRAGAQVGPVFGVCTDRAWYNAILAGDRRPFDSVAARIATVCRANHITQIVADPVELFNPMHDLCSCLAQRVAMRLQGSGGSGAIELLTFPIERADMLRAQAAHTYALDDAALQRKLSAAADYYELTSEVERRRGAIEDLDVERLFPVDIHGVWPRRPREEPFYEGIGRSRIDRGTYSELITYGKHVRPLAMMLTDRSDRAERFTASPPPGRRRRSARPLPY